MADQTSAGEPLPDDFLEFQDSERTPASVVANIRERLAGRPPTHGADLPDIPSFSGDLAPTSGLDPALAAALDRAAELLDGWETGPLLVPSPATRLPLIGPLWSRVRGAAHQLVLFYVNRQGARIVQVQRQLLAALIILARQQAAARRATEDESPSEPTPHEYL